MAVALLERRTDVAAAHQPPRAYRGPSFPTAGNPRAALVSEYSPAVSYGPEVDDKQLLALHLEGDPHAFDELFLRHKDRLWFVALRVTRNREDAADAVQEAMISAFRRAETFRGDAAVSSWLHRITVNAALDRIAKRKRQPTSSIDDVEYELSAASVQSGNTTSAFGQVEANLEISKALSELSDDRRSAIILVDLYGYSLAEAADILEIPEGTVKSRLFRARTQLAEALHHMLPNVQRGGANNESR
ncbi:MAG: RNA polymerase sigma factor SigM [Actinomycetota bacterium]